MQIELQGKIVELAGETSAVTKSVMDAVAANGGAVEMGAATVADILIVSFPLLPLAPYDPSVLLETAKITGEAMAARGSGRIVFLVSAAAGMPMRRHPEFSVAMAGVMATVRTLAMRLGPHVLVNAVGVGAVAVGAVGEALVAGDAAMLGHASVKRPGTIAEITDTVLFFCDPLNTYATGQMLSVDGGWSAGYGRSF